MAAMSGQRQASRSPASGKDRRGTEPRQHDLSTELQTIARAIPENCLQTCTSTLIKVSLAASVYKALTLSVYLPPGYPAETLAADFTSHTLPDELLAKFKVAAEREAAAHLHEAQVLPVVRLIQHLLECNMLIPCWEEIKGAQKLLGENSLKLSEKHGRITALLERDGFRVEVRLGIPNEYPFAAPTLEILSSNFAPQLTDWFAVQARELMRRMCEGRTAAAALRDEANKLCPADIAKGKKEIKVDLSTHGLSSLKSDAAFLAQYRDVRGYEARRERRQLLHAQKKAEEASHGGADAETGNAPELNVSLAQSTPQQQQNSSAHKSVLEVLRFLANEWVWRMPQEPCQLCQERVLPAASEAGAGRPAAPHREGTSRSSEAKSAAHREPLRVHCGHWFHADCLDPYMTTPPFDKACPGCQKPIYHPRWTSNKKLLEKRWAHEEAKKREVGEVADFLGI